MAILKVVVHILCSCRCNCTFWRSFCNKVYERFRHWLAIFFNFKGIEVIFDMDCLFKVPNAFAGNHVNFILNSDYIFQRLWSSFRLPECRLTIDIMCHGISHGGSFFGRKQVRTIALPCLTCGRHASRTCLPRMQVEPACHIKTGKPVSGEWSIWGSSRQGIAEAREDELACQVKPWEGTRTGEGTWVKKATTANQKNLVRMSKMSVFDGDNPLSVENNRGAVGRTKHKFGIWVIPGLHIGRDGTVPAQGGSGTVRLLHFWSLVRPEPSVSTDLMLLFRPGPRGDGDGPIRARPPLRFVHLHSVRNRPRTDPDPSDPCSSDSMYDLKKSIKLLS